MTLMMPSVLMPCCLASRIAANVSAVSPLCEMAISRSVFWKRGCLYRSSEAISMLVWIFVCFSISYLAMWPA